MRCIKTKCTQSVFCFTITTTYPDTTVRDDQTQRENLDTSKAFSRVVIILFDWQRRGGTRSTKDVRQLLTPRWETSLSHRLQRVLHWKTSLLRNSTAGCCFSVFLAVDIDISSGYSIAHSSHGWVVGTRFASRVVIILFD